MNVIGLIRTCVFLGVGILLLVSCVSVPSKSADAETLVLSDHSNRWPVSNTNLSLARNLPEETTISDIIDGQYEDAFQAADSPVPVFRNAENPIWGHIRLKNPRSTDLRLSLINKYTLIEYMDWFIIGPDNEIRHTVSGQFASLDPNELPSRFPMTSLTLQPGETQDVYFRFQSDTIIILPLRVLLEAEWQGSATIDTLSLGLLIGCLFTMAAFGFVFFTAFQKYAFIWFAIFCLTSALHIFMTSGIRKAYIWPYQAYDIIPILFFLQGLGMAASALFVSSFLNTVQEAPRFNRVLYLVAGFSFLTCVASVLPEWAAGLTFIISTAIGPIIIFGGVIVLWSRGVTGAGLVVLSWIPNQAGIVWAYLRSLDMVPYFDANHYTMPVTCTITAIAFMLALHRRTMEAEHSATHDQLTSLPNRLQFERAISKPTHSAQRSIGIMHVDLDGFKIVNDTFGHSAGDHVLKTVAERLRQTCQTHGSTFRTGGDEFIILCNRRTRKEDVKKLAEDIVKTVSLPIEWRDKTLHVGVSIGVAFPREGKETILTAIDEADAALYEAKANGKGQVALSPSFVA